jgi:hypothetical protein
MTPLIEPFGGQTSAAAAVIIRIAHDARANEDDQL